MLRLPDSELPCYSVLGAVIPKPLGGRHLYVTHPWRHREQPPDNSIPVRVRIFGDGYYPPLEEQYWEQVMEYPLLVFPYNSREPAYCGVYRSRGMSEHKYLHVCRLLHRENPLRYYVDADEQLTSSEIVQVILIWAADNNYLEVYARHVEASECALYEYALNSRGYAPYDLPARLGCPVVDGVQRCQLVRASRDESPEINVYMWERDRRQVFQHLFGRGSGGCALLAPVQLTPEQVSDCEHALRASGDVHIVEGGAE